MERDALKELYAGESIDLSLELLYRAENGPVYTAFVPGGDPAIAQWEKLRALVDASGYWPVLMGSHTITATDWQEQQTSDYWQSPATILAKAEAIDAAAWFAKRMKHLPEPDDEVDEWAEYAEEMGLDAPSYGPGQKFLSPFDVLSHAPLERIQLVLVPTRKSYEASAYLNFSAPNADLDPAHIVAIQKYWHQRYGAETVVVAYDILEMKVARPPQTEDQALELAREQYLFCDDIVTQGVMTIDNLRQTLQNSPVWYFWWD